MKYKYSKLQIRRGSREYWESKNPILLQGEPGYDTTNKVLKIGDGNNKWNDLEGINVQNINVDDIKEDILSFSYSDKSNINTINDALNILLDEYYYITPELTFKIKLGSNTISSNTNYEKGTSFSLCTISYDLNKDVKSLNWNINGSVTNSGNLTGDYLLKGHHEQTFTITINSNFTFSLSISDDKTNITKSISVNFYPAIYYGSSTSVTGSDINNLTKVIKSSKSGTYSMTLADNQYGFICLPNTYYNNDILVVNIGGFDTELTREIQIALSNGITYNVYKTGQHSLGAISMVIK